MRCLTTVSEETLWQAVLDRDPDFEGFFYGVRSTGIYCRPTCPSRRPNRNQVCFFQSPEAAETAGFRPCKRCRPEEEMVSHPARDKVLAVCQYIEAQVDRIPTLSELGAHVGMSPSYLQRVFKQIIGISPFEYADALRSERFKQRLQEREEIADALYDTGYGSSSRLYERASKQLGMTPAVYRRNGQGKTIRYAIVQSPLGYLLVAATEVGLCSVRFGEAVATLEQQLKQEFPGASLQPADYELGEWIQALINYLGGTHPWFKLPLDVQATAFQRQVWNALRAIPTGATVSYSDIARAIGRPTAVRAVAHACAVNPVAMAIPCHRVISKSGSLSGYRWGPDRKQALLKLEGQPQSSEAEN